MYERSQFSASVLAVIMTIGLMLGAAGTVHAKKDGVKGPPEPTNDTCEKYFSSKEGPCDALLGPLCDATEYAGRTGDIVNERDVITLVGKLIQAQSKIKVGKFDDGSTDASGKIENYIVKVDTKEAKKISMEAKNCLIGGSGCDSNFLPTMGAVAVQLRIVHQGETAAGSPMFPNCVSK